VEEIEDKDIWSANNKPKLDNNAQHIMEEIIKEKEDEHQSNVCKSSPSFKIPKIKKII